VAKVDSIVIGRLQVDPVLGGHVVKGEQCVRLVGDLGDGLRPLGLELVGKGLDGSLAWALSSASRISASARRAAGWTDFGRAFSTLAETWNSPALLGRLRKDVAHRRQNPRAPSPTASTGARIPRRLQSLKRLAQDSVDSR